MDEMTLVSEYNQLEQEYGRKYAICWFNIAYPEFWEV
jgi:hypothetical protein